MSSHSLPWWTDWQTVRPLMYGSPTIIWLRLVGRLLNQPIPSWPELIRTHAVIEELYAERQAPGAAERWLDPHTQILLSGAIGRLPPPDRELAEREFALLAFRDHWQADHRRLQRRTRILRFSGVVLGFAFLVAGFRWSGTLLAGLAVLISSGLDMVVLLRGYRTGRRLWRDYVAQGGTPLS